MNEDIKLTTIQIERGLKDTTIGPCPNGEYLVMALPIQEYLNDETNGRALIHGKMRELEAFVMQYYIEQLKKKARGGIVKVNGNTPLNIA